MSSNYASCDKRPFCDPRVEVLERSRLDVKRVYNLVLRGSRYVRGVFVVNAREGNARLPPDQISPPSPLPARGSRGESAADFTNVCARRRRHRETPRHHHHISPTHTHAHHTGMYIYPTTRADSAGGSSPRRLSGIITVADRRVYADVTGGVFSLPRRRPHLLVRHFRATLVFMSR